MAIKSTHACLLLLLAAPALAAKPEHFEIDPVHTRIAFQIDHAGFSAPIGTFSGSHGSLDFDENDWSAARLDVRVPIATLELGDAHWREKILDPTFFDAEKFPEARFVSTFVEKTGEHSATIHGELSLHGVTRPVSLAATLNALKRHPLTLKRTAGFSATMLLSRKDFGMDAWKSMVGDAVRVVIEAEAIRSRADTEPTEPDDADGK